MKWFFNTAFSFSFLFFLVKIELWLSWYSLNPTLSESWKWSMELFKSRLESVYDVSSLMIRIGNGFWNEEDESTSCSCLDHLQLHPVGCIQALQVDCNLSWHLLLIIRWTICIWSQPKVIYSSCVLHRQERQNFDKQMRWDVALQNGYNTPEKGMVSRDSHWHLIPVLQLRVC